MARIETQTALAALQALCDPVKAAEMAAYHKVPREYLGVAVPKIDELAREWRAALDHDGPDIAARIALARDLWNTNIHEARIAATRLLTQARIKGDDDVWALILSWLPDFDGWSLADHAMSAASRRISATPARLDQVELWLDDPSMWVRRAALVATLPLARMRNPKPDDLARRDRVLSWLERLADEREWFIQKAIGWWLRDHSRHDPDCVRAWLDQHGPRLKAFARREASRHLG